MQPVIFDAENPTTVHDILWCWSTGHMTASEAIDTLHLDNQMELYEAALASDVPIPGTPNSKDEQLAEAFLQAIARPTDCP